MELKTLQYFSHSLTDPFYEVFQILDNSNHPEYNNLLQDIKTIIRLISYFLKLLNLYLKAKRNSISD